jgi:hypothetical protein
MEAEDSNDPGTAAAAAAGVAGLLQEASILAGLRHPNVVAVYGVVLPPSDILGNSSGFNLVEQEPSLAPGEALWRWCCSGTGARRQCQHAYT